MKSERDMTAVENYLKTLFGISEWDDATRATTAEVASRLGVTPSSVSSMVNKLGDLGYVEHERYGAITLTQAGRVRAMEVVRRHRLVETYLVRALGYGWDEVHDEAEVLEHAVSDLMVERMDEALGHPWRDPHGDPIPTSSGELHQPDAVRLSRREVGARSYVARISDDDPELLRFFSENAVTLDVPVVIAGHKTYEGSTEVELHAETGTVVLDMGPQALDSLWVTDHPPTDRALTANGCAYRNCRHASFAAASASRG